LDVQHVSGLPSVKFFFPTDFSSVELTLRRSIRVTVPNTDRCTEIVGRHKHREMYSYLI